MSFLLLSLLDFLLFLLQMVLNMGHPEGVIFKLFLRDLDKKTETKKDRQLDICK